MNPMAILDESTRIFRDAEFTRQFLGFCLGLTFGLGFDEWKRILTLEAPLWNPPKTTRISNKALVTR